MIQSSPTSIYTDGNYLAHNPNYGQNDSDWKTRFVLTLVERHGLGNAARWIDVGCGAGKIVCNLSQEYPDSRFLGIDISPEALDYAQVHHARDNVSFRRVPLDQVEGHYDLALGIDIIEHVENPFLLIRHAARLADHVIFHIPLEVTVRNVLFPRHVELSWHGVGHIHKYCPTTALLTVEMGGFEIIDTLYTPVFTINKGRVARFLKPLRRASQGLLGEVTSQKILGGYSLMVLARSCHAPRNS